MLTRLNGAEKKLSRDLPKASFHISHIAGATSFADSDAREGSEKRPQMNASVAGSV